MWSAPPCARASPSPCAGDDSGAPLKSSLGLNPLSGVVACVELADWVPGACCGVSSLVTPLQGLSEDSNAAVLARNPGAKLPKQVGVVANGLSLVSLVDAGTANVVVPYAWSRWTASEWQFHSADT